MFLEYSAAFCFQAHCISPARACRQSARLFAFRPAHPSVSWYDQFYDRSRIWWIYCGFSLLFLTFRFFRFHYAVRLHSSGHAAFTSLGELLTFHGSVSIIKASDRFLSGWSAAQGSCSPEIFWPAEREITMKLRKAGIIGIGHVSAHVASALCTQEIADEIVLIDHNQQKVILRSRILRSFRTA